MRNNDGMEGNETESSLSSDWDAYMRLRQFLNLSTTVGSIKIRIREHLSFFAL